MPALVCSSKRSSKQAWQNLMLFYTFALRNVYLQHGGGNTEHRLSLSRYLLFSTINRGRHAFSLQLFSILQTTCYLDTASTLAMGHPLGVITAKKSQRTCQCVRVRATGKHGAP